MSASLDNAPTCTMHVRVCVCVCVCVFVCVRDVYVSECFFFADKRNARKIMRALRRENRDRGRVACWKQRQPKQQAQARCARHLGANRSP